MRFLFLTCLFVSLFSCNESTNVIHEKLFVYSNKNGAKEDPENKGHYFFRHDSINTYGFIDTIRFTEEQLSNKIILDYKGNIRTDHVHSFGSLKVVLFRDNEPIHWSGILLRDEVIDLNKWNQFSGYFVLPSRTHERQYNKAVVFTELAEGKSEKFDIDSVEITFKSVAK
ncbi:MAG: hypothetical protein ACK50A_16210 [Sphingobacteriaceae bacterium]|jgi:hypothetical protein